MKRAIVKYSPVLTVSRDMLRSIALGKKWRTIRMSVPHGHFKFWFCYSKFHSEIRLNSLLYSVIFVPRFHVRILPSVWSCFGFILAFCLLPSVIILPRFHVAFSTLSFALHCVISLPRFHVRFFWDLDCFVLSQKFFFFGHRSLMRNSTQTAVTNMTTKRMLEKKII